MVRTLPSRPSRRATGRPRGSALAALLATLLALAGMTLMLPSSPAAAVTTKTTKVHLSLHVPVKALAPKGTASADVRVTPGEYCRLTLTHAGRAGTPAKKVQSALSRAGNGYLQFSWKVNRTAWAGKWRAQVGCTPSKAKAKKGHFTQHKAVQLTVKQHHKAARGAIAKKVATTRYALSSPYATSAGIGLGGTCQPYGTKLIGGSSWLGGSGVDVIANSHELGSCYGVTNPSGGFAKYQCVELVTRLMAARGWGSWVGVDYASQIYNAESTAVFDKHPNNSGYTPVPGDILVFGGGIKINGVYAGHVAVVESVANGYVYTVEQNSTATGTNSYSFHNGAVSMNSSSILSPIGFLHAKKNGAGVDTSTPPKPTPPPAASGPAGKALTTVTMRSGPGNAYAVTRTIGTGAVVQLSCYATGDAVTGPYGTASYWDETTDGDWAPDALIYTGSNNPVVGACGSVPPPSTAPAANGHGTALDALNLRNGPGTSYGIVRSVAKGTVLYLVCYTTGTSVTGPYGATTVWDKTTNGDWATDAYIYTGSNHPVVPQC